MLLSQRKLLAGCLMCSLLFFTTPKPSEAAVIIITGLITVGTVIADAIILCALFCPSGGGNSGTEVSCEASDIGQSCTLTESCPMGSEETFTGTWVDAGGSTCNCNVNYPSCPANYCGMSAGGNYVCNDCVDDNGNSLPTPADEACTNLDLPDDALVIEPPIVRTGDDIAVSWNLGLNYPSNCTIEGPGIDVTFTGPEDATGTVEGITVTGPHRYELTCGTSYRAEDVQLLPEIYDS